MRIGKITTISAVAGTLLFAASGATLAAVGSRPPARTVQVVSYLGYQVQVPASWHVYHLADDPSQCVLFNRHAVYLGTPGADQDCPVTAFGRTEALLVQPLGSMGSLPPETSVQAGRTTAMPSGTLAAQDAASQVVRIALPAAGVQVTATYGKDPALVRSLLASARITPTAAPQDAPAAGTSDPAGYSAGDPSTVSPEPAASAAISEEPNAPAAASPQPSTVPAVPASSASPAASASASAPSSGTSPANCATPTATPGSTAAATPGETATATPGTTTTPETTATPTPAATSSPTAVPSAGTSPAAGSTPTATPGDDGAPTATPGAGTSAATPAASTSPAESPGPCGAPMATAQAATWPGLTGVPVSGLGFDTCTVPSVTTMTRWLASPFRVAGTYLGGDNWACGYGNFSRSWVTQVAAEGWRFIPIWVGPQAPCSSVPGAVAIDPYQAGAEGRAQAASAVATAAGFGYGKGTPIYFDMEGYDNQISSCRQAVLDFLSSWTQALHAAGYRSGVYSSASSGVADLASQYGRSGYSSPDDIWFAEWNGDPVVADSYLPGHTWPNNQRLHQFDGPNVESFGGTRVNIDDDFVDGAVAGLSMPPGPYVLSQPDAVSVARHMPGQMQLVIGTTATSQSGTGATVQWQVHVARGLTVTPDQGSATAVPGKPDTITLHVAANSSAKPGRYNLPVTATVNGQSLTGTYELVSVRSYEGLPTARPVVLYAADNASMQVAYQAAHDVALPIRYLTGSFSTAWDYAAGGKAVLIAVGQAAVNALYSNPCGWSNPAHARKGSTPFVALGGPLDQPPGTDYFENSADSSASALRLLTGGLAHYALTGTLPNKVFMPSIAANPTGACLGSSSIRVP